MQEYYLSKREPSILFRFKEYFKHKNVLKESWEKFNNSQANFEDLINIIKDSDLHYWYGKDKVQLRGKWATGFIKEFVKDEKNTLTVLTDFTPSQIIKVAEFILERKQSDLENQQIIKKILEHLIGENSRYLLKDELRKHLILRIDMPIYLKEKFNLKHNNSNGLDFNQAIFNKGKK